MGALLLAGSVASYGAPAVEVQSQQAKVCKGVVTDNNGEPIIGASVVVKGSSQGVITDVNGYFELGDVPTGSIVVVSYVGFTPKAFKFDGRQATVVLAEDSQNIDDVVVVAYGTTKKSSFTGSASVVKGDQIAKINGSGFAEALQGMSAGVQVVNNEGTPGSDARIQIRGISSMSGATKPLYVVDGMPYDGALNSINPADIESMTVLKDAAASSLYGSRAANGVVMITTKKGKSGKPTVSFRGAWGTSDLAVPYPKKVSPGQHLLNAWEAHYNDQIYLHGADAQTAGDYASAHVFDDYVNPRTDSNGNTVYVTPFQNLSDPTQYVLHDGNGNAYLNPNLKMVWDESDWDWNKAVFAHKLRQDYSVDVNGQSADGKTSYYTSLGYLDDKGYSNNDFYKRLSFRANVQSQVNNWLTMGGSVAYSYARQNARGFNRALGFHSSICSPYLRNADNTAWEVSEKTGNRVYDYSDNNAFFFGIAPCGKGSYWSNDDDEDFNSNEYNTTSAKYFAEIKLPYDLKFRTGLSLDNNVASNYNYWSAVYGEGQHAPWGTTVLTNGGGGSRSNSKTMSLTWNNVLTWDKTFNGVHNVNAMLGHEYYHYNLNYDYGYGEGIMQAGLYEMASTTANWEVSSLRDRYALLSYFGKAEYNYDNKYYVSASLRRDGSSRFAKQSRWGNFWSVGGSWRVSQESFMESTKDWLSNLAVRASYGTTGNDRLYPRIAKKGTAGDEILYAYQEYYEASDFYGNSGYVPSTVATPNLKWEKNQQFNAAVDFTLFNRINATIEYYNRTAADLLYYKSLPLSAQVGSATGYNTNIGNVRNSGFEFTVSATAIQTNDFVWNIDLNASTLKNEITSLPGGEYTYAWRGINYIMKEGGSLYQFYTYKCLGIDPQDGMPIYEAKDANGNWTTTKDRSSITTASYQDCGSAVPKVFGSITNSFKYKDFDLSFMIYASFGSKLFDMVYREASYGRVGVSVNEDVVDQTWHKPGDNATFARWTYEQDGKICASGDKYLYNNNYARLRNLTFGYTVPKALLNKLGMKSCRIYLSGDNLLTFGAVAKHGTDPETGITGNNYNGNADSDNGVQSSRRVYMAGIQLSF